MKAFCVFVMCGVLLGPSVVLKAQNAPFADHEANADSLGGKRKSQAADPFANSGKRRPMATDRRQAEDRIRQALDENTTQRFDETPLSEVVQRLSEAHDIPIVVDSRSLETIGLSEEEPITIDLKGVSLSSFLRLMLRELDCTYTVHDEVLQITSEEAAEGLRQLRSYRLPEELAGHADEVMAAIETTVQPSAWLKPEGAGAMAAIADQVIVVSGPQRLHEQIEDFLDKVTDSFNQ